MAARKTTRKTRSTTAKSAPNRTTTNAAAPKVTTARKTVKIAPSVPASTVLTAASTAAPTAKQATEMTQTPETSDATGLPVGPTHLRKKNLIDAIAERSGVKRRDAKASVEAALEIMGEAIADGRGLNLPGLGKLKVVRTKKLANAHVYVARIRQADNQGQADPDGSGKDPLAEAAE